MKYADARPIIRSGDLIAQSHGSWRNWREIKTNFVRIFRRSTYSHVGVAWVVAGRVFLLEAVKPKLRMIPMSQAGDFYLLNTQANWSSEAEEYALACVGVVDYSEMDAVRSAFVELEAGNVRQCAAYAREVLKRCGVDLGSISTPDAVVLEALKRPGAELVFVEQ